MSDGMSARARLLGALTGAPVDKTPWAPFLAYWWEAQADALRARPQQDFMRELGADPMLRGFHAAWGMRQTGVDTHQSTRGHARQTTYRTPVGSLSLEYTYSPAANSWFLTGHPLKAAEDYKVLMWMYEHRSVYPDAADMDAALDALGDNGLLVPILGCENKTSFQSLVEHWAGTQDLVYMLADAPEVVEDCLAVMRQVSLETVRLSAQSGAQAFIFWEDSSPTNISPDMFARYTAPEIADWGHMLHRAGKLLIHHACGHLRGLLPHIAALPIDALESVSPPPTGDVTIAQARAALPGHIALIGGIEPVFFEECTMEQLSAQVDALVRGQLGSRYVLANSDSCPPGVSMEKLRAVAAMRDEAHARA